MVPFTGVPRQRGGGVFGVLGRIIPAIIRSPFTRKIAASAVSAVGGMIADKIPSLSASPMGQHAGVAMKNVLRDVGEGADVQQSIKTNARQFVKGMTGLGRKRKIVATSKPIAFMRRAKRSAKITL